MKTECKKALKRLAKKAAKSDANEAVQYTQSVLNLAHALAELKAVKR